MFMLDVLDKSLSIINVFLAGVLVGSVLEYTTGFQRRFVEPFVRRVWDNAVSRYYRIFHRYYE